MTKKKISLVGPIFPFRGGIAQYNTQLHRALQKKGPTLTVSFKRLYPKWLYPGKSDTEPDSNKSSEKAVDYIIDAYSPISLRRAADRIIASKCDLAVLTWWTLFWQPGFAYMARRLRRKGVKTAFLCHNVVDHDASKLKKRISKIFLSQADGYIVHATEEERLLRSLGMDGFILNTKALPVYDHYPPAKLNLPKRGKLEILFFGFIRPYKGLDVLLDALSMLKDKDIYLTIVGEFWGDSRELEQKISDMKIPNVELILEYVDDDTAANFFERADIVAQPYLSATGSAVVSVAYHYRKPVLATNVGGLKDAVRHKETGWLVNPGSSNELADVISSLSRKEAKNTEINISKFCKENSWENLAKKIMEI